jgi:hypothetical protein
VGSDEAFFEDDDQKSPIQDLYSEKAGILDGEEDGEVDLASHAFEIWQNAIKQDKNLKKVVEELPDVVFATKAMPDIADAKEGALVYIRTPDDNDSLAWMERNGEVVTQSPLAILKAAECLPDETALERTEYHHEIVHKGIEHMMEEEHSIHGALGRPSGARFKTYDRLKRWLTQQGNERSLFITDGLVREVEKAMADIYEYPLFQSATDALNRQLKTGIGDIALIERVRALREDGRLCIKEKKDEAQKDMRIICSMGLKDQP